MIDKSLINFLTKKMRMSAKTKVSDLTLGQLIEIQHLMAEYYIREIMKGTLGQFDLKEKDFRPLLDEIRSVNKKNSSSPPRGTSKMISNAEKIIKKRLQSNRKNRK